MADSTPLNCTMCSYDRKPIIKDTSGMHQVTCTSCGCAGPICNDRDVAISNWNTMHVKEKPNLSLASTNSLLQEFSERFKKTGLLYATGEDIKLLKLCKTCLKEIRLNT